MRLLAGALDHFNNVDDVEIIRLYEQSIAITARVEGTSSVNVAVCEYNLAFAYRNRAKRAHVTNDLDREITNLELAIPHYREAARIYRQARNFSDDDCADDAIHCAVQVEEELRLCTIAKTAATTAAATRG